ncbi:MAG: phytochrome sensor protein [Candidatus Handelsmanbacteria bacterium RIFCSPLOWO2_12_FULL_64_10]|uniref:Phytochrome sensor protein n=1 Tax=Handelsmanbacteria sp. (strain RIFCSPLOWO2_12_FULL_64_10) TaxID=1817868 RepID=A0A1F6CRJ0_HANXR|nr:MAG: phytochrome sensor protein [Candidatus Handelsmanbacteria bacterium RIFCSPLOWO2_12_FULL_64_10]
MMNSAESRPRVLVAEDVEENALITTALLEREGFEVAVAQDGELCLEKARSFRPDLIILDLMLPKLHGLQVLKRLKSDPETRAIGVIICTGKTYKTEVHQAKELGAVDFISKPFREQDLLRAMERFFSTSAAAPSEERFEQAPAPLSEGVFRPKIQTDHGVLRLWGTRGSIPVCGPRFMRHGGNTTCLEVDYGDERIIFDAGTGIRDLGLSFVSGKPRKIHLFITHTHWDHIQGFPFFAPAYVPGYDITIYASPNIDKDLKSIFEGQLDRAYFPVQLEDMRANLTFKYLGDEPIQIGDMTVSWEYTLHPSPTVGYKVQIKGKKLAFIPDNEFLKGYLDAPDLVTRNHEAVAVHRKLIDFLLDIDVLIHEAQYTNEEYINKVGWGHTSLSNACALVRLTCPRKWIVIHHDPLHDDDFLQEKLNLTQQILWGLESYTVVVHAHDGMVRYL